MTLRMERPQYHGLRMVISGGQTGADQGGLEAAFDHDVLTGGLIPKGFRTVKGPQPAIAAKYGLLEAETQHYYQRTRLNVEAGDGTVVIASNTNSAGSVQTVSFAKKAKRPYLLLPVNWRMELEERRELGGKLAVWILDHRISVLNVAGNRDVLDTCHHDLARTIVGHALTNLKRLGLVVLKP